MDVVRCPGELAMATLASTCIELREALAERCATIDAGDVTKVDAAGLQLLTVFVRSARARALAVTWRPAPAAVLVAAAATLGLTAALGLTGIDTDRGGATWPES